MTDTQVNTTPDAALPPPEAPVEASAPTEPAAPATAPAPRQVQQQGRFNYVKYDAASAAKSEKIKAAFEALEELLETELGAVGRLRALALTALEESFMWCGKGVRDTQVDRSGDAEHQAARSTE